MTVKEAKGGGGRRTGWRGGGGEAVGLAVTQLRRRLIVSLAKTKGIWNNGQIGAFT